MPPVGAQNFDSRFRESVYAIVINAATQRERSAGVLTAINLALHITLECTFARCALQTAPEMRSLVLAGYIFLTPF